MKHKILGLFLVGAMGFGMVGCGDDDEDDTNNDTTTGIEVSGVLVSHPLNTVAATASGNAVVMGDILLAAVNPPGVAPLSSTVFAAADCPDNVCPFTLTDVDPNVAFGLAFVADNAPDVTDGIFVNTGSGAAAKETVEDAGAEGGSGKVEGTTGFILTKEAMGLVAQLTGNTEADTVGNGYLVGMVTDSAGTGPIAGATVVHMNQAGAVSTVVVPVYPNETFTGLGEATANHGMFFAVSTVAGFQAGALVVTPPDGSDLTWDPRTAGTNAGTGYVVVLTAKAAETTK